MKRILALMVGLLILPACSSHAGGSASTSTTLSPSLPPATAAQLQSALLTAGEVGSVYTSTPAGSGSGSNSGSDAGCAALSKDVNSSGSSAGTNQVEANFKGGDMGPFVVEILVSERGRSFMAHYAGLAAALKACKTWTLTSDGSSTKFRLSPVAFVPGATSVRLDGAIGNISLNGYFAMQHVRNVGVLFVFFQASSGSSQEAAGIFANAVSKVSLTLGN